MSKRTVRHREDGPVRAYYRHLDLGSTPGDELTLDADDAEYLVEKGDHVYVGEADAVEAEPSPTKSADSDADAESEDDEESDEDVTESAYPYNNYSREELEAMEYSDLRDIASQADHPDVNGRSSRDEIIDAFADTDTDE